MDTGGNMREPDEASWVLEMAWVWGAEVSRASVPRQEALWREPVLHIHQAPGLKGVCMVYILAAIH